MFANHKLILLIRAIFILIMVVLLSGCVGEIWTSAKLVYDRHHIYKKLQNMSLSAQAFQLLRRDNLIQDSHSHIELAVFNNDVLLVGQVPTVEIRQELYNRIDKLHGYRRLFKQLQVQMEPPNSLEDSWITAKIRGEILADSDVDPDAFKIITYNQIVYLMGDVQPKQAKIVIGFARQASGVKRVVKLFQYYYLTDKV